MSYSDWGTENDVSYANIEMYFTNESENAASRKWIILIIQTE